MIDFQIILNTSYNLYSKYGLKSVGVDDIAKELGISKKTLYLNIESREDLIEKLVQNKTEQFFEDIKKVSQSKGNAFVRLAKFHAAILKSVENVCPSFTHDLKKYYWNQYRILEELYFEKMYNLFSQMMDQGIAEGLINENTDRLIIYQCQIQKIIFHGNNIPIGNVEQMTNEIVFKLILNDLKGVSTLKGHQVLDDMYDDLMKLI